MATLKEKAEEFNKLKKANSPWFSLEDGESANVLVRSIKAMEKTDPNTGITSAIMSFGFDVEFEDGLKVQTWNTGSTKAVTAMTEKEIDVGSKFTITKHGESFQTTYDFTNVVNKVVATGTPVQATMPAQGTNTSEAKA